MTADQCPVQIGLHQFFVPTFRTPCALTLTTATETFRRRPLDTGTCLELASTWELSCSYLKATCSQRLFNMGIQKLSSFVLKQDNLRRYFILYHDLVESGTSTTEIVLFLLLTTRFTLSHAGLSVIKHFHKTFKSLV